MFEEAQYFAPVATKDDGSVVVELATSHPGFADAVYRQRRNAIAALALNHTPGDPIPAVEYTDEEHRVWALVSKELAVKHQKYAVREFLDAAKRLGLPEDRIPQLQEVGDLLEPLTGFRYLPAAGLVPLREFYGVLADGLFHSTQYIRHHSVPFYTPEPDVIHEVIGHANTLASPRFAALYRAAGRAARRVESDEALEFVSKVFWFTLEFGVMREDGELKAYGAGILSSYGEIEEFREMDIRPLDIAAMGTTQYDITKYQEVLFEAASFDHLEDTVGVFWDTCDDESIARLVAESPA
ncbi:phenylalanine 4-monooxygenase [Microbispora rosea subsp. aerata]|nr:phenylalanine 4-monooxygenase [Microbispora rosea]GGO23939.1 phenylalanine 4-monooxygenase [Microbispora rosea subsp. aerata]GIH57856.1 phenylalanine 4-monooxygenase [Microbispora rosea subsp. aerata]GLJ86067.1 phenylalanine 4-monooxygenase [Microbispora rosea subsp. aerata]